MDFVGGVHRLEVIQVCEVGVGVVDHHLCEWCI